jgi:tetratricopeptide (TPR) repeat protein
MRPIQPILFAVLAICLQGTSLTAAGAAETVRPASVSMSGTNVVLGFGEPQSGSPPGPGEDSRLRLDEPPLGEELMQLQEQLQATLATLERFRLQSEAESRRNSEAMVDKLSSIEEVLATRGEREIDLMKDLNQFTMAVAIVFAGIGFLGLMAIIWFQFRMMSRTQAVSGRLMRHFVGSGALGAPETALIGAPLKGELTAAIRALEERIRELEPTAAREPVQKMSAGATQSPANGHPHSIEEAYGGDGGTAATQAKGSVPEVGKTTEAPPWTDQKQAGAESARQATETAAAQLRKGQSLLEENQVDAAMACFDEVIALEPGNAEAWVKKGLSLERLNRLDEAIRMYDRAIAADNRLTVAWLYKGGTLNRMERYDEALQCYEQALRTQQASYAG